MAFEMSVQLPLATASATVVNAELKYECVMQPRSQGHRMAGAAAVDGLGEIRGARGHYGAAKLFLDAIAEESF